jgi:hypothetical protein
MAQDLRELKLEIEAILFREVNRAITSQTRTIMFGMIATLVSTASVMLAAIAIGG